MGEHSRDQRIGHLAVLLSTVLLTIFVVFASVSFLTATNFSITVNYSGTVPSTFSIIYYSRTRGLIMECLPDSAVNSTDLNQTFKSVPAIFEYILIISDKLFKKVINSNIFNGCVFFPWQINQDQNNFQEQNRAIILMQALYLITYMIAIGMGVLTLIGIICGSVIFACLLIKVPSRSLVLDHQHKAVLVLNWIQFHTSIIYGVACVVYLYTEHLKATSRSDFEQAFGNFAQDLRDSTSYTWGFGLLFMGLAFIASVYSAVFIFIASAYLRHPPSYKFVQNTGSNWPSPIPAGDFSNPTPPSAPHAINSVNMFHRQQAEYETPSTDRRTRISCLNYNPYIHEPDL